MGWIYDLDAPPQGSREELTQLLGGKGAGLVVMAHDLGLPVPGGFVVTTEACRYYLDGAWPEGLDEELRQHMDRLGQQVGRRFGAADDPLLVSVRSGAPVSMPGMMDTVLNLGLTATTIDGFAKAMGSADFAADCSRRLADGWRSVIGGGILPRLSREVTKPPPGWRMAVGDRRRLSAGRRVGAAARVGRGCIPLMELGPGEGLP